MRNNKKYIALSAVVIGAFAALMWFLIVGQKGKLVIPTKLPVQHVIDQKVVLGIVEKISGQEITIGNMKVKDLNSSTTVRIGSSGSSIVAIAGPSTTIERLIPIPKNNAATTKSAPFSLKRVDIGGIKIGDMIAAVADKNISERTSSFTALRINVQSPGK